MSFARVLFNDLVEKRLWPAAVLLVLAAIVVPVVVALSGSTATPPVAPPAPPPLQPAGLPAPGKALDVIAGPQTPRQQAFHNYEHNPFRKPYGPKTPNAASASTAGASASTVKTSASPGAGTNAKTKTTTPTAAPTPTPTTTAPRVGGTTPSAGQPTSFGPLDSYRVDVQATDSTGAHTATHLPRLSPLPNPADPLLLFLGVLKGGARAAFLFPRPVRFVGAFSGRCLPSIDACEIVELGSGQAVGLLLAGATDTTKPQVTFSPTITIEAHSTKAAAQKVRAQRSSQGLALLAKADPAARQALRYSTRGGALTEAAPVSVKGP